MTAKHLFFIDALVAPTKIFEDALPSDTAFFVLNSEQSGIAQIASISAGFVDLDSIQIISHGSAGSVQLGSDILENTNLEAHQENLRLIGAALVETGDLILYGCNVGLGSEGSSFVQQLAKLTRADIAASDDLTGAMELGGDWELEVQTGTISVGLAFEQFYGLLASEGNDSIVGTANADTLSGLGGDDTIDGLEGNDLLEGGNGNDKIFGGVGDDILDGGAGYNTLEGGEGHDRLTGSSEWNIAQVLDGGLGNDTISAPAYANSTLSGGADEDVIMALGADYVFGGDGSDFVSLRTLDSSGIQGGDGNDTLSITGDFFNEELSTATEFESLQFNIRDSYLSVSLPDSFFAAGVDGQILRAGEYPYGITEINGSLETDANLLITGDSKGRNQLTGGALGDELIGGQANDTLKGSGGDDTLRGGVGTDTAIYSGNFADYSIFTVEGGLQIQGGIDGTDRLYQINSLAFADIVVDAQNPGIFFQGTPGNDKQIGVEGNDTLFGNAGDDRFSALLGNDLVDGGAGADTLRGGDGNDSIYGGSENDQLYGDGGSDILDAGSGDDLVIAAPTQGTQAPFVAGGLGNDTVRIETASHATVLGGDGNDSLTLHAPDAVDCGPGSDILNWTQIVTTSSGGFIDGGDGLDYVSLTSGNTIEGLRRFKNFETLSYVHQSIPSAPLVLPDSFFAPGGTGAVYLSNQTVPCVVDASAEKDKMLLLENLSEIAATLVGGALDDVLRSDVSGNSFRGNSGNDQIFGGLGIDTALFSGSYSEYTLATLNGRLQVTDSVLGRDGVDLLRNINFLTFSDQTVKVPPAPDNLIGTEGSDTLTSGEGNDTINGLAGPDEMNGQNGYDTYYVDQQGDRVIENLNGGIDLIITGTDLTLPQNVENLTLQGAAKIGYGNALNNRIAANANGNSLFGSSGNDTLVGSFGDDQLSPGTGMDLVFGNPGNDTIIGSVGQDHDSYDGGSGIDIVSYGDCTQAIKVNLVTGAIVGSEIDTNTLISIEGIIAGMGADSLVGNLGQTFLDGGGGLDTLIGGVGNDTYGVDSTGDHIFEGNAPADGTDTVLASLGWTLAPNFENLTLTGTAAINATGNTASNALTGNQNANVFNGQGGNDTMAGAAGNDTYYLDSTSDLVIESVASSSEVDRVVSSVSRSLETNVENLELTGALPLTGIGNASANKLVGNSAANLLDGKFGIDTMIGGSGGDEYRVDNPGDLVVESGLNPGDIDTARSSVSYSLSANVERLVLLGTAAINATGTSLENTLVGNAGQNRLDGLAGADLLMGGVGGDTYVVDNPGDVISEKQTATPEIDIVQSSVSRTLENNVENLTLTGAGALHGIGNSLANWIRGTSGANLLDGLAGADKLEGGAGADIYYLDNANDVVIEPNGSQAAVDTILSSAHCTLPTNVENLTLQGSLSLQGIGNTLANAIVGNPGANRLDGKAGADTLYGKEGSDTYVIDSLDDKIIESSSANEVDSVESMVSWTLGSNLENLTLQGNASLSGTGNALGNRLVGNSASNRLLGNAGNDILIGANSPGGSGFERDSLTGGVSADFFVLANVDSSFYTVGGLGDYAMITDFEAGTDRLVLRGAPSQYSFTSPGTPGGEVGLYLGSGLSAELIAVINSPDETVLTAALVIGSARFV